MEIDFNHYRFLNIGGGKFCQRDNGWLNLDYPFDRTQYKRPWENIDIIHNLMEFKPIDLPDSCMNGIYTEHTIEHLPDGLVMHLFKEIWRILKENGILRIAVPDAQKFYDMLIDPDVPSSDYPSVWSKKGNASKEQIFLDAIITPICGKMTDREVRDIIENNVMDEALDILVGKCPPITTEMQKDCPGWHLSWWNHRKLSAILEEYGFKNITQPLGRCESCLKAFRREYIDRTAHKITLRMECSKNE